MVYSISNHRPFAILNLSVSLSYTRSVFSFPVLIVIVLKSIARGTCERISLFHSPTETDTHIKYNKNRNGKLLIIDILTRRNGDMEFNVFYDNARSWRFSRQPKRHSEKVQVNARNLNVSNHILMSLWLAEYHFSDEDIILGESIAFCIFLTSTDMSTVWFQIIVSSKYSRHIRFDTKFCELFNIQATNM